MKETWKDIPEYEGIYQISNTGRINSLKFGKVRELKFSINNGYFYVNLRKDKISKVFSVHQLVAMVFLGHQRNGYKKVVDHINSNGFDNRVENLKVITHRENNSKERTKKSGLPVGVSFYKKSGKFMSTIYISGKIKYLGLFEKPKEASEAYQYELNKIKK